jgi:hypothetical protein
MASRQFVTLNNGKLSGAVSMRRSRPLKDEPTINPA